MIQRYISQNEIKLIGQVDLFYVLPAGCVKPDLKNPCGIKTVWKHSPGPVQAADTQACHERLISKNLHISN